MLKQIAIGLTDLNLPKGFTDYVITRLEQLQAEPDGREISAVIAAETGRSETIVDQVIARRLVALSRAKHTLEMAIAGGVEEAAETFNDIEAEPLRVPIRRKPVSSSPHLVEAAC